MRVSLVARFVLALTAIAIISLALTAYLNQAKVRDSLSALVQSRFAVLLREVKSAIESSMGVGLDLSQLRSTQDIIERLKQQDEDVRSLEVFDRRGQIIFSTQSASLGQAVPAAWTRANRLAKAGEPWHWSDDSVHALGLAVMSPLGLVEGAVVLTYSPAVLASRLDPMVVSLARFTGMLLTMFLGLTILGVTLVLRRSRRRLAELETGLHRVFDRDGGSPIVPGAWQFEHRLAEFEQTARGLMDEIEAAGEEVAALGRTAP